jgi:hypothetical protein
MSNELTECEIILTNLKWDAWYVGYMTYRKARNENYEYVISLTPKKKRQIMSDWIKNSHIDFCKPDRKTTHYSLPSCVGVSYETRRKKWRVYHKGKHIDYFQTFEQAKNARQICEKII